MFACNKKGIYVTINLVLTLPLQYQSIRTYTNTYMEINILRRFRLLFLAMTSDRVLPISLD